MMELLPPKFVEKPWGRFDIPLGFSASERQIGEIWFEPPAELGRVLVKYLFTSQKVSVQVHPTDEQALALGDGLSGKDECWLVLAADEGAAFGIGFDHELSEAELRSAAEEGRLDELLVWHPASAGDFFYLPANHVHAIGAGLTLMEVQQTSDIAYRLYDYDRGRELDLDKALAVAKRGRYPERLHRHVPDEPHVPLVDGPHFRLDRLSREIPGAVLEMYEGKPLLVVTLEGEMAVDGSTVPPGRCAVATDIAGVRLADGGTCLVTQQT